MVGVVHGVIGLCADCSDWLRTGPWFNPDVQKIWMAVPDRLRLGSRQQTVRSTAFYFWHVGLLGHCSANCRPAEHCHGGVSDGNRPLLAAPDPDLVHRTSSRGS